MDSVLEVTGLSVSFKTAEGELQAVRDVSFSLQEGEVLAIVGESGCGKSVLCKSMLKLLPASAWIKSGSITSGSLDITNCCGQEMEKLRGKLFSIIFQDPMNVLDPTMAVGSQIAEAVRLHFPKMGRRQIKERVLELMDFTGIEQPRQRYGMYPHHFSGGMRQRAVIAAALASAPKILIADEPTTALDVTVQAQILSLIRKIQRELGMAMLLVTHDLGIVASIADRVAVMYAGKIVETGTACEIFHEPRHPYTWGLLRSLPAYAAGGQELYTLPGMPPNPLNLPKGDAFACRNEYALAVDYEKEPPMMRVSDTHYAATWLLDKRAPKIPVPSFGNFHGPGNAGIRPYAPHRTDAGTLVDVQGLCYKFRFAKGGDIRAVDGVSFQIQKGEILGLVGESGSGKSTVARCLMNLCRLSPGHVFYKGIDIYDRRQYRRNKQMLSQKRQLIFQDCASSLNPHMKVADIIAEPLAISRRRGFLHGEGLREEARLQLHYVGMDDSYLDKYPYELSGGMRQRVAIARALSMEPELLIADEPVASLDASIQAQIINLFRHLQKEHEFTILFIAHDLSVVKHLCSRAAVMYRGKIVEIAPVAELFANPLHPYTQSLISAIPGLDPMAARGQGIYRPGVHRFCLDGVLSMCSPGHFVLGGSPK